jgi:hypothetical protein
MEQEKNLVTVSTLKELLDQLMEGCPTEKEYLAQRKSERISAGKRLSYLSRVRVRRAELARIEENN